MSFELALSQTAKSYIEVGRERFSAGMFDEAISATEKALGYQSELVEAHALIGHIHAKQKRWTDCIDSYRRVLELKPDSLQVYVQLGDALKKVGRLRDAIAVCRQAERQGRVAPGIFRLLGNIMESERRLDEAIHFYQKFIEYKPDAIQGYIALARCLKGSGQFIEAVHHCDLAVAKGAQTPEVFKIKAQALRQLGRLDLATDYYRRFLEQKPDVSGIYIELGNALLLQKKYDEVIDCCNQAKQQKSCLPGIYRLLGVALQHQGYLETSIANYRKFLAAKPNESWAYAALGKVLRQAGAYDEAISCFQDAAQRGHAPKQMNQFIAEIYQAQSRSNEAVSFYQKALELSTCSQTSVEHQELFLSATTTLTSSAQI